MWIERMEFIGFGNLTGQRIEFGRNKLSIVVQPNEYGKSTIAEAIWATMFDYPDERGGDRKPLSGAAFKSVLDISSDRHMRLIRNFAEHSLKVLDLERDLSKANADITAEFAEAIAQGEFGTKLTGLSRTLFRSCCMIGQRQLDYSPFSGDRSLSSLLLSLADSGGTSANVFEAIARIEETLENFPFRGKSYVASDLVELLQNSRGALADNLKVLENERQGCDRDVERLAEVEARLKAQMKEIYADEYFRLCLEAADIDTRLSRAQEKGLRVAEVQNLIKAYSKCEHFPIEQQKDVEELWIGRQSRLSDLRRLEGEVETKSVESQIRDVEQRERGEGLDHFTIEDSQVLSSLARTLQDVSQDLTETCKKRDQEFARVKALGVDLNQISEVRACLLRLEPKELDDAHAYHAMLVGARERAAEHERSVERARTMLSEISTQRESFVGTIQKFFWPSLIVACVLLGTFVYMTTVNHQSISDSPVSLTLSFYVLACALAGGSLFGSRRVQNGYRVKDENHARIEESKQSAQAQELYGKILGLDARLEELARRANLGDGMQLVNYMQEYAKSAAQLKELDLLDHMALSKDAYVGKLKSELADFFRKANRRIEDINPGEALIFADTVHRFLDGRRRMESSLGYMDHRHSEIRFLTDEVRHSESLLADQFQRAGLQFTDTQDGYYQWTEAIVAYRRWEANRNELIRMEADTTTELIPSELPQIIERLEAKKSDLWKRISEIIVSNPDIAMMPPPMIDRDLSDLRLLVDELRRERDELTVQLRAAMKNYQDNYLRTLEALESIERELKFVETQRTSLLLARDTFQRLADENHSVWGDKLTDITREMLKHLGTEYESIEFGADLSMSVRRKGAREAMNEAAMSGHLSTGTREQLHWLARMAVVRFLSNNMALPIVLDEPFSEFDDERFLKIMRFLINNIARHNQVIIFSCHQQRHEWLMDQLDPRERDSVELCRLVSLNTLSVR